MASPEQQIEFLSNLQRLLAEGSFVSTYKYALLLSLADLCVEYGHDDDAPLEIPTRRIGGKFAEYFNVNAHRPRWNSRQRQAVFRLALPEFRPDDRKQASSQNENPKRQ